MNTTVLSKLSRALGIGVTFAVYVQAQSFSVQPQAHQWVIEAVGTARAVPDVSHIMMKMEYEAALARDAAAQGEKRLGEFLAAVDALKLPGLTYRVSNNLFTQPNQG